MVSEERTSREKLLLALLLHETGAVCPAVMWEYVLESLKGNGSDAWCVLPPFAVDRLRTILDERPNSLDQHEKEFVAGVRFVKDRLDR